MKSVIRRRGSLRCAVFVVFGCGILAATGCGEEPVAVAPASVVTVTPAPTVTVQVLSIEAARQVFLAAVCPTESALHQVENVALAAGGWSQAPAEQVSFAAGEAASAAALAAELLTKEGRWAPSLVADVRATIDEFLELASPLQQLADARFSEDRERAWIKVESSSRVAEQRLRLNLGLGLARGPEDGCPPAPRVTPASPSPRLPQPASPSAPDTGGPVPATGPLPELTGPMVESTSDGICYLDPYAMPPLVGPDSDESATRMIQIFAVMNGINPGAIDGQYGPNTIAAVMELQRLVGVVADGQVGPITWGALKQYHCPGG